jgi:hypothetical protein
VVYLVSDNIEWNDAFDDFIKAKGGKAIVKKFYSLGIVRKL